MSKKTFRILDERGYSGRGRDISLRRCDRVHLAVEQNFSTRDTDSAKMPNSRPESSSTKREYCLAIALLSVFIDILDKYHSLHSRLHYRCPDARTRYANRLNPENSTGTGNVPPPPSTCSDICGLQRIALESACPGIFYPLRLWFRFRAL